MHKFFKILFLIFCIMTIFCYSYDENLGAFLPGETLLSGGTYTVSETSGGTILGQSAADNFTMDTFLDKNDSLENADVRMTARNIEITYPENIENTPTDNNYVYPGAQITVYLLLTNFNGILADSYTIKDIIPANTHLYYTGKPPTLNGDVYNIEYLGVTNNAGAGNIVEFLFDLAPSGSATFSYTVTVD